MNKFLNKVLFASASLLLTASFANAKNTVCYKDNWNTPSTVEFTKFDGGECKGQYSIKEMEEKGWRILDIKIESKQNALSFKYLLTNDPKQEEPEKKFVYKDAKTKKLSFQAFGVKIDNLKDNKTTINIGNLVVGQSGVVIHLHDRDKRLIVANAKVISSNEKTSIIEFSKFDDLQQDAIPTSKRGVEKGDILALNYLYNSSLLIAPSQETFQLVRENFRYNNFLHTDIFASSLKDQEEPLPTKKIIQEFAIKQNLGTIFVVVNNKVNVIDTKTFSTLATYDISYNSDDSQLPFYTRIEKIEASALSFIKNFSFKNFEIEDDYLDIKDILFGKSKEDQQKLTYDEYYSKILGLK